MYQLLLATMLVGQNNNLLEVQTKDNDLLGKVSFSATTTKKYDPYIEATELAVRTNKTLYIFIDKDPYKIPGGVSVRVDGPFDGEQGPAIVVAIPDNQGWLNKTEVRRDDTPRPFRQTILEERLQQQQQQQQPRFQLQQQSFSLPRGRSSGSC